MLSDSGVQAPAKQGFDIYMDEPEQGDRDSCAGREGMAFEDAYEVDTSTFKSDLHFLLDFNTGNLTHLWLTVPWVCNRRQCSLAYGKQKITTK